MALRDYQELAIQLIREEFQKGNKKVLLRLATGAGKTVCFSEMMKSAVSNGKKCVMFVRGRQLVDQAHKRLMRENVSHGVIMSNHWAKNLRAPIQIASIDTITSRQLYPEADFIVIDEAHMATSPGYKEVMKKYPDAYVVAVTATPYTREPLSHVADIAISPITMIELIDQGYLLAPRYFAPSHPDLRGVGTVNGDYIAEQVRDRMSVITGDIVSHWKKLGEGRPTICFAVNIEHSNSIVAEFNKNGITAEHIEANTSFAQREAAIGRLIKGHTKILSNVGILCTGVDIPPLGAIIMARPTKSYSLYVQQVGRGTRLSPETGKKDFLLLDHSGNIGRHGFVTKEPEIKLQGYKKEMSFSGPVPRTCPKCFLVYESGKECPGCGPSAPRGRGTFQEQDGELEEIKEVPLADEIVQFVKMIRKEAREKGYNKPWVYLQVRNKYGSAVAMEIFPERPGKLRAMPGYLKRR